MQYNFLKHNIHLIYKKFTRQTWKIPDFLDCAVLRKYVDEWVKLPEPSHSYTLSPSQLHLRFRPILGSTDETMAIRKRGHNRTIV